MTKYLIKKWYYLLAGIIIFLLLNYVLKIHISILEIICLFFFIRFVDDLFDYEKDEGKRLNKTPLVILSIAAGLSYIVINVINHDFYGLISVGVILYILLMNKLSFLKPFALSFTLLYYLSISASYSYVWLIYIICSFIIGLIFKYAKRYKV